MEKRISHSVAMCQAKQTAVVLRYSADKEGDMSPARRPCPPQNSRSTRMEHSMVKPGHVNRLTMLVCESKFAAKCIG